MGADESAERVSTDPASRPYRVATAARLMEAEFAAKWHERSGIGPLPRRVLVAIHDLILATGAPVSLAAVAAALPDEEPARVREAVVTLDDRDLIVVNDGRVVLAYPLAAQPTAFEVRLPDGRIRHAPCAIDALGIPAFLGQAVTIRSACFHCREPLTIDVHREGPTGPSDIMVWVGQRTGVRDKAWSGL